MGDHQVVNDQGDDLGETAGFKRPQKQNPGDHRHDQVEPLP